MNFHVWVYGIKAVHTPIWVVSISSMDCVLDHYNFSLAVYHFSFLYISVFFVFNQVIIK